MTYYTYADSPFGPLLLTGNGEALTGLYMDGQRHGPGVAPEWRRADHREPFARARAELEAYFAGLGTTFTVPLAPFGTAFQSRVWEELRRIPYGETISYGELARRIGAPAASRAVGLANGRNPIGIVIPCHRVIGAGGRLVGYGGGLDRKSFLLALETRGRPGSTDGAR